MLARTQSFFLFMVFELKVTVDSLAAVPPCSGGVGKNSLHVDIFIKGAASDLGRKCYNPHK